MSEPPARRIERRQGRFLLRLEPQERGLIRQLLDELRELLTLSPDDPRVRRLYPSAHAEDAELENEYRSLTRDELQNGRLASIDAVEASVDAELLDIEQLGAWMQAVNSLRLILGTMLDIRDDDQELAFNPDDPNARTVALYGYLGGLLDEIVDAQLSD
jgi:predicted component of type VI protein secretion system